MTSTITSQIPQQLISVRLRRDFLVTSMTKEDVLDIVMYISIGGGELEQVKEFCCLGSMFATDAKCHLTDRLGLGPKYTRSKIMCHSNE